MASEEFIEVPVLKGFDQNAVIGHLRIRSSDLPPDPNFVLALGFQGQNSIAGPPGSIPTVAYRGPWSLQCVGLVSDPQYFAYLMQIGHKP